MVCSPHKPFFLLGSEDMSAPCNLLTQASSYIISALSRTSSNLVATCFPKNLYFYSVFLDTDIILNNPDEHIKAINRFHLHSIFISWQGSS